MKIATLIHSRTYNCDFKTDFLVKPDDFLDKDIQDARKIILSGTTNIDNMNGVRWLIVKNNRIKIAGIVCFIKDLAELCNFNEEEINDYKRYFTDNKGRLIYGFIGFSLKGHLDNLNGIFSYKYLWDTFIKNVETVWQRTVIDGEVSEYEDFHTQNKDEFSDDDINALPNSEQIDDMVLYETNTKFDRKLFIHYLKQDNNDIQFCSNLLDKKEIGKHNFSVITTTGNIITRLKKENPQSDIQRKSENNYNQIPNNRQIRYKGDKKKQKKSLKKLYISGFVIIILILLWFIIEKM